MTMPTFTDTALVHQGSLNALSNGINYQSLLLTGVPAPRAYIPTATAKLTSAQVVLNTTDQVVPFDAAGINNDVIWSVGASAFIIQTGGVYVAWGQAVWDANATGTRSCSVLLNGVHPFGNGVALVAMKAASGTDLMAVSCETAPMALAPGAALYLNVWQNSGAGLNIGTGLGGTFCSVMRLGNQM